MLKLHPIVHVPLLSAHLDYIQNEFTPKSETQKWNPKMKRTLTFILNLILKCIAGAKPSKFKVAHSVSLTFKFK